MADRQKFQEKLGEILKQAASQGEKITKEEVQYFFESDSLTNEQLDLVCEYLLAQKVVVEGYEKKPVEEEKEEVSLDADNQVYVEQFLKELEEMPDNEEQMQHYLRKVVEEAVNIWEPGIIIGDVIQEGSVSLMLALAEGISEEVQIMEKVRAGMTAMIESQAESALQDKKMLEKVENLDETIKSMTEEYGRKVAVDEVAEKLGISEEEIADILKLAGEEAPGDEE